MTDWITRKAHREMLDGYERLINSFDLDDPVQKDQRDRVIQRMVKPLALVDVIIYGTEESSGQRKSAEAGKLGCYISKLGSYFRRFKCKPRK